jgi:hypothetical protein
MSGEPTVISERIANLTELAHLLDVALGTSYGYGS